MAGFVSTVGLVVMLRALTHTQHAVFFGITVLATVMAAGSPNTDESTHRPLGFHIPTGLSSSALPDSHHTTFKIPESPSALASIPGPTEEARTAATMLFQWGHNAHETPSHALVEEPHILTTPFVKTLETALESTPQSEESAKHPTDWKTSRTSLDYQTSSLLPDSTILQSNTSVTPLSPPPFTGSAPHPGLQSEEKAPPSKQQDVTSEQTPPVMTLATGQPLESPELSFFDSLADGSHSQRDDSGHLKPSIVPLVDNKPVFNVNMLPSPDKIKSPGYNVPFITPHPTSPSSDPTEASPEDFYPTNTMDVDWGSGDYLETMSFYDSDRDEYSLVTKVPSDPYDLEDYTESYDTSFPSRVGISPSSLIPLRVSPSPSLTTAYSAVVPQKSIYPSPFSTTTHMTLDPTPTPNTDVPDGSDIDWAESFTIQPTDVLLPDMNSLEYYITQLSKENSSSAAGAEHGGNVTVVFINSTELTPTTGFTTDANLAEDESSSDLSGFEPHDESTTEESPQLINVSQPFLHPSVVPTHFIDPSSSTWGGQVSTSDLSAYTLTVGVDAPLSEALQPSSTPLLPEDPASYSSLTDVHWFVTDSFSESTILTTAVLTATVAFTPVPTQPAANDTAGTTEPTSQDSTEQALNMTSVPTDSSTHNVTSVPPVMLGDQGMTEDGADILTTVTSMPTNSEVNTVSAAPTITTAIPTTHQAATGADTTTETLTSVSIMSTTSSKTTTTASRQYLCKHDSPAYLTKIAFPSGATVGYAKSQIRDILKAEFNKSVEVQVVDPPPKFMFRVVSGPIVYTAISVINALRRSGRRFLSVSPNWKMPDRKYQVHTVLQFVPGHIDVRYCNFSESTEKGLTKAFAEVRRRSKESTNFTVHIVNITMAAPKYEDQRLVRNPVDITFTVSGSRGYVLGSEVSNTLMKLTVVEFTFHMGFPVLQIAEPFHYPELNTSHLLRSSWVRTVLLGVLDQKVGERTFQANMERRVAMLLGEAMGLGRRVKRATTIGNNSVQVVSVSRLVEADHPLEIVYFVEGPSGERMPAVQTANLLNSLDVQRAAIVLGYRVQGILAQPVEKVASSPSDTENTNMWIIIGVVIPILVVIVIISILYWKLCRTDKLEFQPDAMTTIQQRQKSTTSFSESRSSLRQPLPQAKGHIEFSEDEEGEYEEEEEEEEEEEMEVKRGKKPVAAPKSKHSTSEEDEEEEEEEDEEEEEEEEDEEEEEEEEGEDEWDSEDEEEDDDEDEKGKVKKKETTSQEQKRQESKAVLKKPGGMKTGETSRVLSKGRRAEEELQAPSVKGFDFAKLHLGQQSKDDVMVIQESVPPGPGSGPLPVSIKDGFSPSENGEILTPKSKTSASSTKASRSGRRRERISPSDGDSVVSDHSSERESTEENLRAQAPPSDSKQTRKNRIGPPPTNGATSEQLSSASIFEHVDRMSRATDASRRLPNKVQLIAMQPMPVPPLHTLPINGKLSDTNQISKEIQVALRHKSEIEHHRNKIRLRAKRKGHYDFPAMDDMVGGLGDAKEQDRIYQKAQTQIDKILDPDAQMPPIFMEPKKSVRGRRSPKQRLKDQLNGGMMEADKDQLICEDSDVAYRKCPGINNVAFVSDPDQGPGSPHRSPSPTDDVFLGPACSPPGHAPPPPPYMPPQPSIEEARQQMHSLLDDAFALVSPTSQGSTAGITLPGVNNNNHHGSSPPGRGPRAWGPSYQSLGPLPSRFSELDMSSASVQGLTPRQGLGSGYLPPGEAAGHREQLQPDSLYSSRGFYADELPSSARPRPVGGSTGAQLHHLTQVGLSSRMNGYPAGIRAAPGQNGGIGWNHYHDDNPFRGDPEKDPMHRSGIREPTAPPAHLDSAGVGYLAAPAPLDTSPPIQSSASLIKAIREELLRLSQKQAAVPSYHS